MSLALRAFCGEVKIQIKRQNNVTIVSSKVLKLPQVNTWFQLFRDA